MTTIDIQPAELLGRVKEMRDQGMRLVQMHCSNPSHFEVIYSFDRGYELTNLRVIMQERVELESVTDFYPGAFLYENEISELFGIRVRGMNIDYQGNLYQTGKKEAFTKASIEARAKAAAEGRVE
jgi:ech hydrogenase subunit D